MPKVFISYRRSDNAYAALQIYERLKSRFGKTSVFFDVDAIGPGEDFRVALEEKVAKCDVLLALIGKEWLNNKNDAGKRRLDDPLDFVRIEIAEALRGDRLVIPVLLDDVDMPTGDDLPYDLRALESRNAVKVRAAPDFFGDVDRLIGSFGRELKKRSRKKRNERISKLSPFSKEKRTSRPSADQQPSPAALPYRSMSHEEQVAWTRGTLDPPKRKSHFTKTVFFVTLLAVICGPGIAMIWYATRAKEQIAETDHAGGPRKTDKTKTKTQPVDPAPPGPGIKEQPEPEPEPEPGWREVARFVTKSRAAVWALAAHPREEWLAVGDARGNTALLNITSREQENEFVASQYDGRVYELQFDPSGRYLAASYYNSRLRVWDVTNGKIALELETDGTITAMGFSSDNEYFAIANGTKRLFVWNWKSMLSESETPREIAVPGEERWYIMDLALSQDGTQLAICKGDRVLIWSLEDSREHIEFEATEVMSCLCFGPDDKTIVAGGYYTGVVHVWDLVKQKELHNRRMRAHEANVLDLQFSPDGKVLYTGGYDGRIRLWDSSDSAALGVYYCSPDDEQVYPLLLDRAGRYAVSGYRTEHAVADHLVRVWQLPPNAE